MAVPASYLSGFELTGVSLWFSAQYTPEISNDGRTSVVSVGATDPPEEKSVERLVYKNVLLHFRLSPYQLFN